ncbi:filamentous hemagglutinin N-terminal domain-containing protein [Pseudomonas sp. FW305-3-2-15-E-TSA4]|uniref:two-partner secretion domain-containing protein n=1 Tax=Pseudomonas sp. FW305-3-2-15-E-TSA4 TaxID=2259621 RepID=UPI000CD1D6BE|nr:filamentous hemagglutinin N-terminal domain-containing protein [Pseudomonas sp. FW305-3-2-15-E-TSA4]POA23970.1 hemagglutinin [Pseudomonas sp. FW305-3-2-15-E-TSA4]
MDVRQFAFLAGQPSAAVKNRESFLGMPKRGLAFLLANVMFWQPMWAQADGIVVANPNTALDRAGNGVPIINIATPNGSGLSHNQFHDYNVGAQGVILNNGSSQTSNTQLGGHIIGNPNLKNSGSAQAILNEVISGNPSQLRGYTEVAGQSARVIVANPYGITCNGCGFINSPRVTLTTGKPVLDGAGRLDRFQVDQGSVAIEGAGLNANNVDRFEIITRSAKINAELQAQNLTIVAGRNDVNAQTLNVTARADDGSAKPQLAIDSSALGGMYAGAIKLVGTEAGVGVKLDGKLIASGGDIQLDANGQLSLADTSATGAVNAKAASLDARGPVYAGTTLNVQTQGNLTNRQTLAARDSINLSAGGQLTNAGVIEAGVNADGSRNANGDLSLSAQNLDNTGKSLIAGRNLTVSTAQTLSNQGGTLSGQTTAITAGTLDNRNSGRVLGNATLNVTANQLFNTQGVIHSSGHLTGSFGQLDNSNGEFSSSGVTRLNAATVNNRSGQILGDLGLNIDLSGALDNRDGVLGSGQWVSLQAASLDNRDGGVLVSDGSLTVRLRGALDNRNKGEITAKGAIDAQTGNLDNRDGKLIGKTTLALRSDTADNRAGVIQADQQLTLNVDRLDNRDKGQITGKSGIAYAGTRLDNSGGLISAVGPVSLNAGEVQNAAGRISSQNDLTATIGLLQQQGGALVAQGNLSLTGKTLDNRNGGLVGTTKALTLTVDDIDNRNGEISSSLLLNIKGQRLDNSDSGKLLAGTDLGLAVAKLINLNQGLISAKGATTLTGSSLDNSGGRFNSLNGLVITLDDALINAQGTISSEGTLTANLGRFDNSAGGLSTAGVLSVTSRGAVLNRAGSINTDSSLTLTSASLDNSQKGLISAKGASHVDTGDFDNSLGGKLTSEASLTLKAAQVNNATGRIASQQALNVSVTGLDQQGGELFSKSDLTLDLNHGQLNNQNGLINAPGTLLLKNLNGVNNHSGEISSQQAFTLAANDLDNSNGKLISQQGLTLRIAQALNNLKGVISAAALDSHSVSLDNQDGLISSRGPLVLTTDKTLNNQSGTLIADGELALTADTLVNQQGSIAGKSDASVQVKNLNNQNGKLIATGMLKLSAETLDNRQGGLLGSTKAMTLTVAELDNRGGEISTNSDLLLTGKKLDNSDGGKVFISQALTLTVDQLLNRNKGLIDTGTLLKLQGRTLDNSGGELLSQQDMLLNLSGDFTNQLGKVSSEGALTVNTAQLSNTGGSLSSAADITLDSSGNIDNQAGRIVTDGALVLKSTGLDNRQKGTLSGKGAVTVTTGDFDNSSGSLSSADTLNLVAGQVTNSDAGSIGSQGALTASVTGFDQQGGKLLSNTRLNLDLNHGQLNNINGVISAPGTLLLKQLNGVNNQGGTISSTEAFVLTAQSLDNSNGKLLSNQGLTLRIANALDNVKGLIGAASIDARAGSLNNSGGSLVSRGDLELTVDGLLRNDASGLISAAQALNISSADLNNQSGTLLGVSAVTLNAMALNNRDSGLINSKGNLKLTATSLDSSNGGEVSAAGDIDLTLTSLTQNGGRLLGDQAITLELANGDLDNQSGLLTAKGPLTLKRLRDLNNQRGEISSNLSFDVIARAVNNNAGKLISGEKLLLRGTSITNQKGLLSGWQGLSVSGNSLDNRDSGTLSSKFGDVAVELQDALLNSGAGALVAEGSLTVKAGSLDNSNKGILSSGAGQTLTLSGALNNSQGGLIASDGALDLLSMALTNVGGAINAQQAITATVSRLDNSGGQIASNDAITLNLSGDLNNNGGRLAGAGPVLIKGVTDLSNQNGQLASQKNLNLSSGTLDNSNKGTIAANDLLQITASGAVRNNADGLIYSQNAALQLKAASLNNGKGALQSENGLTLDISGDLDNQSGKVIAQNGDVSINAANIDNRGGTLSSIKGALDARTVGVLRNGYDLNNNRQGGIIQAQGLKLSALAGLDNNGGRISAQATDANITTAGFDNRNGVLYAKGLVSVSGTNLDNGAGQIAGERIDFGLSGALSNVAGVIESNTQLAVRAASVNNQNGRLRSLGNSGKTDLQIGGQLDNRNGVLETANTDMTVNVGSFLNDGGQLNHVGRGKFEISTANVIGAGGSITTGGLLELNADTWNNSSVIQAGTLNVNVRQFSQSASGKLLASDVLQLRGGNWTNDGLIASDGLIDMQLSGGYSGNGRLSSQRGTYLSAAQMNIGAGGSFAAGATSTISVGGALINAGRITSSEDLIVNAGSVTNYGTLGAAQNLNINTPSLLNDRGLIFSGNDMTLSVGNLTNQKGDFYGLGNVTIKGYGGAARAAGVYNISGSMESGGGFQINADVFENRTEGPVMSGDRKLISGYIANICNDCRGGTFTFTLIARELFQSTDTDSSASAVLNVGKDFVFKGGTFLNSKSTIAASGNIDITADNLKNIGAKSGTIERSSTYVLTMGGGTTTQFLEDVVMPYNQRNNPDFPYVYYIDPSGGIRKAIPKSGRIREGNRDGEWYDVVSLKDSETGAVVSALRGYGIALPALNYGFETTTPSLYDPNNLVELPGQLTQYKAESVTEIAVDSTGAASTNTGRNAVIQAGGNVSITAAKELENSVIHQDYGSTGGTNKVGNTNVGNTGTTVIRINSQLPPDLAQQQVNPLSLPGFSLPTGENGLFRLSGQGAADTAPVAATGPAPTWTVGGQTVATEAHVVAGSSGGPRNLFIDAPPAVSDSTRAVDTFHRTPSVVQAVASTVDVNVPVKPAGPGMKDRGNDARESIDTRPVTRVTGLPDTKAPSNAHKYLIETNPVLTDLKSFMSSDYLLEKLGYDPDQSAKRLGDGLYEQRLIQQAVTARTGQAFIDGQTSNEGMFKYLMNNAIASKDALNLSVGVGLTSQQVAALTHDIVWLEEHEVNGEKVLVPVVYLAQANGRLGPTGALIAGNDVTLIAGENLDNVGTLKATNNLSATAGNNLINSGLIQAGNRLDLLATNDIINKSGGVITGREVSLNTLSGDVINERTVTSSDSSTRFGTQHHDFADTAARIEATNDLSIMSGRDINISGGVLQSGRDMDLDAERDLNIAATQVTNSVFHDSKHNSSDVTQLGANVNAGRDFTAQAGRDLAVIASQIDAKRDVSMSAAENLIISSAADEQHSLSKGKKLTVQEDHVSQVMSGVTAGGSVALSSGEDLTVVSSRVTAGDEAYLVAGNNLNILAAQDTDYSLYDKKKKGSFGSSKTKRDEVTKVDNIGSVITSGGDMVLVSNGDQHYQAAKLDSGNDLTITSGGSVTFEGVKDLHQESHEKSSSSSVWSSAKGRGNTDETLRQTELTANGNLVINAIDGLNIDLRDINQKSVSQTIDAMVKADPGLAWLKDAEKRGDVDWRMVKETHESFKYSNSGMGPAAMLAVVIIVSVLTAGTGTAATIGATAGQAASSAAIAAGASASTAATIAAAASAAATAAFSAAVGQAATSAINNKGNLGDTFKDVIASESFKSYVFAAITAGIASKFGYNPTDLNFDLDSVQSVAMKATFDALAKTAVMGGSLQDNLVSSALGSVVAIGGAVAANKIGDITVFDQGKVTKVVMHAALGGLMAEAMGGDFRTGAIAAGANEALVDFLADKLLPVGVDKNSAVYQQGVNKLLAASQLVGVLTAAITGGDASTAAAVTANATQYNNLDHPSAERLLKELEGCRSTAGCSAQTIRDIVTKYEDLSAQRSMAINDCKSRACVDEIQSSAVSMDTPVAKDLLNFLRRNVSYDMVGLLNGNPWSIAVPSQGVDGWGALFTSDKQMAFAKNLAEGWLTPDEMALADQWAKDTSWLDQQAGQPLTLQQRATLMTELQMTAGMLLIGKSAPYQTGIEFKPKWTRKSVGQIDAYTSPSEAIKTLEANGYNRTFSGDGTVSMLTKGDRTYKFYPMSTSTKEPTAELLIKGIDRSIVKIRFKVE